MKRILKHWKLLIFVAVVLIFCAYTFGWGGGPINVMDFAAEDVDRIELSCSHPWIADGRAVVTEKEDIQTVIDSVNGFRHDGTELKYFLKYGFSAGGSVLHTIYVYFTNGEEYIFCICPEAHSDTQLSCWEYFEPYHPRDRNRFRAVCSGSLDWFYALHEKYTTGIELDNAPNF